MRANSPKFFPEGRCPRLAGVALGRFQFLRRDAWRREISRALPIPRALWPASWLPAILLLLAAGFSTPAAARCVFEPMVNGFLHGSQHLPANAKGVLFRIQGPLPTYWLRHPKFKGYGLVLDSLPPVTAGQFSIVEIARRRKLTPVVERLELSGQPGQTQPRLFATRDPRLLRCAAANLASLDGCPELDNGVEAFIANGILREVTDEVEKSIGTFRVSPAEGFEAGKDYRIAFIAAPKDRHERRYIRALRLRLDNTTLPPLARNAATLVREGAVIRYELPAAIAPYRDYLHFDTRLKPAGGSGDFVPLKEMEARHNLATSGQDCGGHSALGKDRPWGAYFADVLPACHEAKGWIGFFEMQDAPAESDGLRVNCP